MNKNIIIWAVVLILIAAAAFFFVSQKPEGEVVGTPASYSDGTTVVTASFDNENGTVTFTHPSVGTVTLPQALSASGARYANEDESIVFWEHQGEVTITVGGETVFHGPKDGEEHPEHSEAEPEPEAESQDEQPAEVQVEVEVAD